MLIKILGAGCPNYKTLEKRVKGVVKYNNIEAEVQKVENIGFIKETNLVLTKNSNKKSN